MRKPVDKLQTFLLRFQQTKGKPVTSQLIKKAQAFAQKAHSAQTYDQYPYFKHLEDVYNVLIEFGYTYEPLLAASFIHDVLEDTATSYSDLKKEFGEEIAEIVYCMTDEMGRNRKEKKEKTYPKIRSNPYSIILKLCDRIANVRHSKATAEDGKSFSVMYKKEYIGFRWALYVSGHAQELWDELDKLMEFEGI